MSFERTVIRAAERVEAPVASSASVAAPGPSPAARPRGLPELFAGLVDRWIAAAARRREAKRLRSMPDYLLKDIGLTRDDVRSGDALRRHALVRR